MNNEDNMLDKARLFNRAAAKEHALKCSKERRAGKFTRVGGDFFDEVEADLAALLRELRNKWRSDAYEPVPADEATVFVTGEYMEKVRAELDAAVARMIQSKVARQPSCGCTIGRTR